MNDSPCSDFSRALCETRLWIFDRFSPRELWLSVDHTILCVIWNEMPRIYRTRPFSFLRKQHHPTIASPTPNTQFTALFCQDCELARPVPSKTESKVNRFLSPPFGGSTCASERERKPISQYRCRPPGVTPSGPFSEFDQIYRPHDPTEGFQQHQKYTTWPTTCRS